MRAELFLGALVLATLPAHGQALSAKAITRQIEGVWGWPEAGDRFDAHSCLKAPTRIWIEAHGSIYKSKTAHEAKTYISQVTVVKNRPDAIFIKYTEPKQVDIFGRPLLWSLTMPDRDTFIWKLEPNGPQFRKLVRCAEGIG